MRALVIADVHGNLAALEAVLGVPHDVLICLGDIVGYGPEPGACVRRLAAEADVMVRGDHDHALASGARPSCRPSAQWLAEATARVSDAQLTDRDRAMLAQLPTRVARTIDGFRCILAHATPTDPPYWYLEPTAAAWAPELQAVDADAVVVGHTHVQGRLAVAGRTMLNPGSVGQPRDGDPRAAYAIIEDGAISLGRVAYPVERTIAGLEHSGVEPAATEVLAYTLRTGRLPGA